MFFVLFWSTAASSIAGLITLDASSPLATYRAFVAAGLGAAAAARGLGPLKRWLDAAHGARARRAVPRGVAAAEPRG